MEVGVVGWWLFILCYLSICIAIFLLAYLQLLMINSAYTGGYTDVGGVVRLGWEW